MDGDHKIARGDIVSVMVYGEPELNVRGLRVSSRGTITLPYLDEVRVEGMTISQAKNLITRLYEKDYLVDPQVIVFLESTTSISQQYIIWGKVARPGTYSIPPDTKLTLIEAISLAGGFAPSARQGAVEVKRKTKGREELFQFDAKAIQKGEALDPQIMPGDFINVPESFW